MAENDETRDNSQELIDDVAETVKEAAEETVAEVETAEAETEVAEEVADVEEEVEELTAEALAGQRAAEALKKTLDNPDSLNSSVQAAVKRTEEETRRVEKAVKQTKSNPVWFVPLFSFFLVLGLVWVIVYYIQSGYPIPGIGTWNLLIGFAIMMVGFVLMMFWH
ncbi:cell division protein CrgA [Alloscardovia theropitheci]|uniref:Cell division protein CrgA n=1 Tax=Alloscardovia theropitheci TaxID=2496842 RepID=A0A4R0QQ01_9BIFI|nr:cell division protein CrgA [Alloscardovia theropitheci]TCD54344.1 cell division protein CrgA [Alloscardovia theropitheci]